MREIEIAPDGREMLRLHDNYGRLIVEADTTGMMFPVRCRHCNHVYDVGAVRVKQRYSDCDVWDCPGCHAEVDNRPLSGDIEDLYR